MLLGSEISTRVSKEATIPHSRLLGQICMLFAIKYTESFEAHRLLE